MHNDRYYKYAISKITTSNRDQLYLHDGYDVANCHESDDRFSGTIQGMQCVANTMCALMYSTKPDVSLKQHLDDI